jgi:hypothetical protein
MYMKNKGIKPKRESGSKTEYAIKKKEIDKK